MRYTCKCMGLSTHAVVEGSALTSSNEGLKPYSRVVAVSLCGMFAFLNMYCTQPLLPLLAKVFRASEARVSLTISASTFGVAIAAGLLAMFGERVNRKRMIVIAMIAMGIVTMVTATSPSLEVLIVWRFIQGLLTPGVFIITIAYVTEEWPAILVPRVMSWYVAGTVFGGFSGRVTGGMLAESFGWRPMFIILGIAGLGGAWLAQRLLRPSTPRLSSSDAGASAISMLAPMRANLRNPRLLATFGVGFCMLFTLVSLFSYITFHLSVAPFYLSTAALSWLFAVYLVGLLSTLGVGTVLARIGLLRGLLGAITLCIGGTLLTLAPSLVAVGIGLSLASSGVFIAQTCANSFLRDAAPAGSRVSAAGLYICCYYIGGTVGGVLPGLTWKQAGWPGCVAMTCGFLMTAANLAFWGWRRKVSALDPIRV